MIDIATASAQQFFGFKIFSTSRVLAMCLPPIVGLPALEADVVGKPLHGGLCRWFACLKSLIGEPHQGFPLHIFEEILDWFEQIRKGVVVDLVSSPLDDLCIDIWISVMIIYLYLYMIIYQMTKR